MAVLLVGLGVMSVLMATAMPVWRQAVKREKEEELIFRGRQYARAIGLFQRKYANASPPSVDALIQQRFLRRKYRDPMVPDGEFQVLYQASARVPGAGATQAGRSASGASDTQTTQDRSGGSQTAVGPQGGIIGVASKSTDESIRLYDGRSHYNEWQFVYTVTTTQPGGVPGRGQPGGVPGRGQPGGVPGRGQPGGASPGPASSSPFGIGPSRPPR
jgi:type II secretory pathway pseudopilin PulG